MFVSPPAKDTRLIELTETTKLLGVFLVKLLIDLVSDHPSRRRIVTSIHRFRVGAVLLNRVGLYKKATKVGGLAVVDI